MANINLANIKLANTNSEQILPQFNPFVYHDKLLTDNITGLTSYMMHFTNIYDTNAKLRDKIYELEKEHIEINNKQKELELQLIIEKAKNNKIKEPVKKPDVAMKTIFYRPHHNSWSDEKIASVLSSIKSIDSIISLNGYWNNLKHHIILQRLYHTITPLTKLKNMVGMENIKMDVFKKIIYHVMNMHDNDYLNTIISGPPGVGKTEFAKIYGEIFQRLGILKNGNFIEIKRDDLVGQFLGHTASKTKELFDKAIGGVIFLDEAYSLGNSEKRDSFSKEAIDMINQYLSEKKGQFMFIIAGYEEDLESCFFAYNKGLKRRFHSHYKINSYEPKEMKEILLRKITNNMYTTNIEDTVLLQFFVDNKDTFEYYGGDIEKLFNEIKQCVALRTFKNIGKNSMSSKNIIIDDIMMALKIFNEKKKDVVPHGMYI